MILEFGDALNFVVANIWFKKNEGRLITYETEKCRTVIDYILIRKSHCGLVGSARTWDGTGCEFDSWQCRI